MNELRLDKFSGIGGGGGGGGNIAPLVSMNTILQSTGYATHNSMAKAHMLYILYICCIELIATINSI